MKLSFCSWLQVNLVLSSFMILFSWTIQAQDQQDLRNQLITELTNQDLTGAVWSIVKDGKIYTDSWGIKNTDAQSKLTYDDLVHVGSVAKTVLATGVLLFVTQNKLSLETPVEEILPEIKFENSWEQQVTVRHLLDHTSGLENLRLWQLFSQKVSPNTPLLQTFLKDPSVLKIKTEPGTQFSYSNMGYTLLGLVIEKVSGERYEDFLDTNLLFPLGMLNSTFHFVDQVGPEANSRLAMGHMDNKSTQSALPNNLRPAAQFTTNARDMGIFLQFLLNEGIKDGKQIVSKDLLAEMGLVSGTDAAIKGLERGYSLGLMQRDRHNVIGLYHSGNIVGYRAMIYLFPIQQKAFFISINMDSETANYENINKIFIENLALEKEKEVAVGKFPENFEEWEGIYIPTKSTFKLFRYFDILTGFLFVKNKDKQITLFPFQQDGKILYPVENLLFRAQDRTLPSHIFYKNKGGLFLSDGINTFEKVNDSYLYLLLFSFILGVSGIIYILLKGIQVSLNKSTVFFKKPISIPFLTIVLLMLPIPFFLLQSFVSLGDKTVASVLAANVTIILPLGFLYGMWQELLVMKNNQKLSFDFLAFFAVIQLILVLFYYGLIPLMLWV